MSLLFEAGSLPKVMPQRPDRLRPKRKDDLKVSCELELGRAAEHLVCADLLLAGWSAYPTAQGLPYDLAVDVGRRIIRVQVKSSFFPKNPQPTSRANPAYFFHIRRAGRGAARVYRGDEFDIYALVALDRRLIAYFAMAELPNQSAVLRVPGGRYGYGAATEREFEGATFERALRMLYEMEGATGPAAARETPAAA
jgi:hypothetical protein